MSKETMRNPVLRGDYNNPAGDVMKELSEIDLDRVTGGIDYKSNYYSCGYFCTITGECQGTRVFLCCR